MADSEITIAPALAVTRGRREGVLFFILLSVVPAFGSLARLFEVFRIGAGRTPHVSPIGSAVVAIILLSGATSVVVTAWRTPRIGPLRVDKETLKTRAGGLHFGDPVSLGWDDEGVGERALLLTNASGETIALRLSDYATAEGWAFFRQLAARADPGLARDELLARCDAAPPEDQRRWHPVVALALVCMAVADAAGVAIIAMRFGR